MNNLTLIKPNEQWYVGETEISLISPDEILVRQQGKFINLSRADVWWIRGIGVNIEYPIKPQSLKCEYNIKKGRFTITARKESVFISDSMLDKIVELMRLDADI